MLSVRQRNKMTEDQIKPVTIKVDPDQVSNPWHSNNLEDYLYYNCQECDLKTKDQVEFYSHAIQNHVRAKEVFMVEETIEPKEELKQESSDEEIEEEVLKKKKVEKVQCYLCGQIFEDSSDVKDHIRSFHPEVSSGQVWKTFGPPRDFQCSICNVCYKDEDSLKMHICGLLPPDWLGQSLGGMHQCPKCNKEINRYVKLLEHYAKFHSEVKKFPCEQCDFRGATSSILREHKLTHSISMQCDICHKTFKNRIILAKHKKEIHQGKKIIKDFKTATCEICNYTGKLRDVLTHKEYSHPDSLQNYKCDSCDFESILKEELQKHQKTEHEATNICHLCGKRFTYPFKLKAHMESQHRTEPIQEPTKDFICDQCGKGFVNKQRLRHHCYMVHGTKAFLCTFCDKMFSRKTFLQEHYASAHQVFVTNAYFPCTKCDKQFNSSFELNSHLVSQHECQSEFQCHECSHSFVNTVLLTAHKIEQHNFDPFKKVENENEMRHKFKCDICGDYLKTEGILRYHKKAKHEKESHAFKCDLCHFTTHQLSRLKQHKLRQHEKIRHKTKYHCSECPKIVTEKRYLRLHLMNEHGLTLDS